jgi:tRNA (adenine-N(6)-)-methyltransferase
LIVHAERLLTPHGKFQVILPVEEACQLIAYARRYHLFPRKITRVHPNPGKAPKRLLIQLTRQALPPVETDLTVELSRHHYSEEYIALTREFYLKME